MTKSAENRQTKGSGNSAGALLRRARNLLPIWKERQTSLAGPPFSRTGVDTTIRNCEANHATGAAAPFARPPFSCSDRESAILFSPFDAVLYSSTFQNSQRLRVLRHGEVLQHRVLVMARSCNGRQEPLQRGNCGENEVCLRVMGYIVRAFC